LQNRLAAVSSTGAKALPAGPVGACLSSGYGELIRSKRLGGCPAGWGAWPTVRLRPGATHS